MSAATETRAAVKIIVKRQDPFEVCFVYRQEGDGPLEKIHSCTWEADAGIWARGYEAALKREGKQ